MPSASTSQASYNTFHRLQAIRVGIVAASQSKQGQSGSGPGRPLWLPGSKVPGHLTGDLPGDYGFDPLKLGAEKQALRW